MAPLRYCGDGMQADPIVHPDSTIDEIGTVVTVYASEQVVGLRLTMHHPNVIRVQLVMAREDVRELCLHTSLQSGYRQRGRAVDHSLIV